MHDLKLGPGPYYTFYRPYHLTHHKYTEQPEDPDLVLSRPFPVTKGSLVRKFVRDLTGRIVTWIEIGASNALRRLRSRIHFSWMAKASPVSMVRLHAT